MQPEIEGYRFGRIVVDGESHTRDLIILPGRVVGGWWRQEGHRLDADDLDAVFEAKPEVLVVGQGAYGRMKVPPETAQAIAEQGIELVAQPTGQACDTYNELRDGRQVAAALHLTC
ncbi:MAG: Mth938-like domain-containing protein [Anaerolineae bacterium]|nr:Mth938-like domain-containing protein [Anaerolineae bacterium]